MFSTDFALILVRILSFFLLQDIFFLCYDSQRSVRPRIAFFFVNNTQPLKCFMLVLIVFSAHASILSRGLDCGVERQLLRRHFRAAAVFQLAAAHQTRDHRRRCATNITYASALQ